MSLCKISFFPSKQVMWIHLHLKSQRVSGFDQRYLNFITCTVHANHTGEHWLISVPNKATKSLFFKKILHLVTECISMTIPHCICCPSCHLETHSNMMCFVLSNIGTLPAARPSHFTSLVCFVFLLVPQHAVGLSAYHSLSLSYVCGCGTIFIQYLCHACLCWSSLPVCTVFQTWVKLCLQIVLYVVYLVTVTTFNPHIQMC